MHEGHDNVHRETDMNDENAKTTEKIPAPATGEKIDPSVAEHVQPANIVIPSGTTAGARIVEAQAAREAAMLKELGSLVKPDIEALETDALRGQLTGQRSPQDRAWEVPGHDPSQHPDAERAQGMPSNRSKAPPSFIGQPSHDPRDWASGIAAGDPEIASQGVVGKVVRNETGTTIYVTKDGRNIHVQNDQRSDWAFHEDGSADTVNYERSAGNWVETTREHHLPGSPGIPEQVLPPVKMNLRGDPRRMPRDDDASIDPAVRHYDHSARTPAAEVTKVDPGPEGAQKQPQAAQLKVPDLVSEPRERRRELSPEDAARLAERLPREKGPGGHPGDPDLGK
jgi:hypothetical protein